MSRGGNLLLNVGPTADGRIPDVQRLALEGLARWMAVNASAIHDAHPAEPALARAGCAGTACRSIDRAGGLVSAGHR